MEIGIDGANWLQQAQDCPMAGCCEHVDESPISIRKRIFSTSWVIISFSNNYLQH
jgi:hypothetical protein